jgi:hypothetical protein
VHVKAVARYTLLVVLIRGPIGVGQRAALREWYDRGRYVRDWHGVFQSIIQGASKVPKDALGRK